MCVAPPMRSAFRALTLLALLCTGCTTPASPPTAAAPETPSPPPTRASPSPTAPPVAQAPSGAPPAVERPYVPQVMMEYMAFAPGNNVISHHGEMLVLDPQCPPVGVMSMPSWPQEPLEKIIHTRSVAIVSTNRTPGPQGYPIIQVVVRPTEKQALKGLWTYDLSWEQRRVPYLHERGGPNRFLSLTVQSFKDGPRTRYCVAVPDNVIGLFCTDYPPFRRRSMNGWTMLDYDTTNVPSATIHVGFRFNGTPATPPPAFADVFAALAQGDATPSPTP